MFRLSRSRLESTMPIRTLSNSKSKSVHSVQVKLPDYDFTTALQPYSSSEIEVFKLSPGELMSIEQKIECANRFSDLVDQLQLEEMILNHNFKNFIDEFSTTSRKTRSSRNSKSSKKRRGISNNEYNLHKLHEKLKTELPLILAPSYSNHDFSIYDKNVKLEIYNEHKNYIYQGIGKYKVMWTMAVKKVSVELSNPTFEIMNSRIDLKRGQIEIKWRVAARTKLHSSVSRLIRISPDAGMKDYRMISTLSVDDVGKVFSHVISDMEINTGPQVARNDLFAGVLVGLGVSAPQTEHYL